MFPELQYSYNYNVHRSIKTKPADVTVQNEKKEWNVLHDDRNAVKNVKYRFKIANQLC